MQKASATATSGVSNTNREIAKFNQKTLFSAIYSGVQNAAAPSFLELLELFTPGAKKNCCMLNYLQMFIAPKLCAINADPSENLHTSSTDRDWDLIKIWTQTVLITKSYDQNKFQLFLLKKNAFFAWKSLLQNGRNRSAAMWTSDDSYWRQKKNCSYYPEHFKFHFYSFKNDLFFCEKLKKSVKSIHFFNSFAKKQSFLKE